MDATVLFLSSDSERIKNLGGGYDGGALPSHSMPYDAIGQLEGNQFGFSNDAWGKRYDLDPLEQLVRN